MSEMARKDSKTSNQLRKMFEQDFELYESLQKEMILVTKMSDPDAVYKEFKDVILRSWTMGEIEKLGAEADES
jgi:hypothetical protein